MAFFRNLADRVRERAVAPSLPIAPMAPVDITKFPINAPRLGYDPGFYMPTEQFFDRAGLAKQAPVAPTLPINPRANDVRTPNIPSIPEGIAPLPGESLRDFIQRGGANPPPADAKQAPVGGLTIEEAVASSGRVPGQYSVDPRDNRGGFNPLTGQPPPVGSRPPDAIQAPVATPTPIAPAVTTPVATPTQPIDIGTPTAPVLTPAEQPLAPYTGAGYDPFGEQPFVGSVVRNETGLDALTKQMLFGLDGQGGFIPGAMQAAETTFFNPDGTPRVVEEQVADLSPDALAAMDLIRANVGVQNPFLRGAEGAFRQGVSDIGQGIERGRGFQQQGLQALQSGIGGLRGELGGVEGIARGAAGNFATQLGGIAGRGIGATDRFGRRLSESENLMRGTTGAYDQGLTSQFYNPYEDRVVQQTIDDVFEAGEKQDMAQRARDIATGGESAFGSRARLGAAERREALGRGLGEALGGIRSRGFSEAQQTGLGEFARQRQAERLASSGLAGLSGQRLGAQQALGSQLTGLSGAQLGAQQNLGSTLAGLAGTRFGAAQTGAGALSNMGALETQYGQDLAGAQFGLGSNLQNLGAARQQAGAFDVDQLLGAGSVQQAQTQAQLDAQRRNQIQAQQAPLAQYQSLAPFVSMAPAGQFTTSTQFTPRPSALQAGLATGLGAFGAIGNFMNQGQR